MTYTESGDKVTLEMTRDDYSTLMFMLSGALGSASQGRGLSFNSCLRFVNELNRTNPNFTPYEVPATAKEKADA